MRIVVLRALGLGDFLTAVPAYRALRRHFGDAEIVLAAPRVLEPLLPLVGDAIDRIAETHALAPLAAELHEADLAVNLHGRGPQSHRVLLAARPRALIAFHNADVAESAHGARYAQGEHDVARWCRLLQHAGIAANPAELDLRIPPVTVPPRVRGATLLHPGAASEARRWPAERWIEVARAEQRAGRSVVLTGGSGGEAEIARTIAAGAGLPATHVYAGRTSLQGLAAFVAAAGRVVCGDTGIAHLATAYRTPSVVLFGPSAPSAWGPPARPYHRVLWHGTTGDPHANRVDPGLLAILPDRVIAALDDLAARTAGVRGVSTHAAVLSERLPSRT